MSGVLPEDRLYLRHILDAIARIESYLSGVDRPRFDATPLLQDGVIRQLEIIGEATKHLSPVARTQAPGAPWRKIAGMRDKLTHGYMGVDIDAVWLTATGELGALRHIVEGLLGGTASDSNGA
jgi:uncharacterized protein with HEPN domain